MNFDGCDSQELLLLAGAAQSAERYDDMCDILKKLTLDKIVKKQALTVDERNLLSIAYKNAAGPKRKCWRVITQGQENLADEVSECIQEYRRVVEAELEDICKEAIDLTDKLIAMDVKIDTEYIVFLLKMSADYYRYLAEFKDDDEYRKNAETSYRDAYDMAKKHLSETHVTRLGLALNYSVCCFEIIKNTDLACQIAKEAFDSSIEKLDTLNDSTYKDSTLIMQLLRDNLTLWSSGVDGDCTKQ